MVERISDIHMHVVPYVDDGAFDLEMSIEMLRSAYAQGVRHVFCTSHSWEEAEERDEYEEFFSQLRRRAAEEEIGITLHSGNEVFLSLQNVEEVLHRLQDGILLPLNNTRFVLTEFRTSIPFSAVRQILQKLLEHDYTPVIAHAERYLNIDVSEWESVTQMGCMLQINAYSLVQEKENAIREKAQALLQKQLVSFLGSDAHTTHHRPPTYGEGVAYIARTCEPSYASDLCCRNAERLFIDR